MLNEDFARHIERREASCSPEEITPERVLPRIQLQGKDGEVGTVHESNNHNHRPEHDATTRKLSWKKRIRHITWAYFTLTMATGGMANVLYTG